MSNFNKELMVYCEDDWKAEVEVLEDNSDAGWERYTLKVIKILEESRMYKPFPGGKIFEVGKPKNWCYCGMWHLSKEV